MRQTRIGKRISGRRVSPDIVCFRLYCCATVDTALVTLRGKGEGRILYSMLQQERTDDAK